MYECLVKPLRYCATHDCCGEGEREAGCAAPYSLRKDCNTCNQVLQAQAADAIEELNHKIESLESKFEISPEAEYAIDKHADNLISHMEELIKGLKSKSCWIPVTEPPPETQQSILGQKSSKVIVAFRYDDGTQGTDTAHTLNGNWIFEDRITVVNRTITHWMPLPKPLKEEEE